MSIRNRIEIFQHGWIKDSITLLFAFTCLFVFKLPAFADVAQSVKLLSSDGAEGDRFGSSVAIDGDFAIIGYLLLKTENIVPVPPTSFCLL